MKSLRNILLSCCLALAAGALFAEDFPRPQGWVSDYAGVMDAASKQKTENVIRELETKTSAEIAVVTVKTLEGNTVEQYAADLLSAWGVGKKGKDNGVLILASIDDRKIRIEVGYGLEGILPDGKTGAILDRYVMPEFRKGDFGQGLYLGTLAVASVIAEDAGVQMTGELPAEQPENIQLSPLQAALSILILIIAVIILIRHPFLFFLFFGGGRGRGGGFGGGFGGGGFGGFGGGSSGGGGASRGW